MGSSLEIKRPGRGVKLKTNLHLMSISRMSGDLYSPSCPHVFERKILPF
jgi:hypothetical protein